MEKLREAMEKANKHAEEGAGGVVIAAKGGGPVGIGLIREMVRVIESHEREIQELKKRLK